jgi:hypothetical protein
MNDLSSYLQIINSQKEYVISTKKNGIKGALQSLGLEDSTLMLGPMNTDVRLGALPKREVSPALIGVMAERPPPPESFFLKNDFDRGDLIEEPRFQKSCGSCWAISAAGIVGDCFVVSGKVDYSPRLSTTYILSNYPQGQCKGGNQGKVFEDLAKSGVSSQHCVDYAWCDENEACNPSSSKDDEGGKEFRTKSSSGGEKISQQSWSSEAENPEQKKGDLKQQDPAGYLNSQIPPPGCFFPNNKKLYYIKDVEHIFPKDPKDEAQLIAFRNIVKHHIMEQGPVSSGYMVFSNMIGGKYDVTKGVYLESVDYKNNSIQPSQDNQMVGGHAVAVVGWGVEKNLEYAPGKRADVPYWHVRNSWSKKWNGDGYFKVAMYPYNQACGFDVPVETGQSGQTTSFGGFVLCKADKIVENGITKTIPDSFMKGDSNFFKEESSRGGGSKKSLRKGTQNTIQLLILIICLVIALAFLGFIFYKFFKK